MQTITIGKNEAGQRLDKFLHKLLPLAGSGFLYKMLRKKNITLNGRKAEGKEFLNRGDVVTCFFSRETYEKFAGTAPLKSDVSAGESACPAGNAGKTAEPEKRRPGLAVPGPGRRLSEYREAFRFLSGVEVLYENEDILLLNKPAGILTQKASGADLTLNEWLVGYLLAGGAVREEELRAFRPSVCNRLDRNTSGIVLCGKTLAGSQFLGEAIRERGVRKFYRTICVGEVAEDFILEGYLEKNESKNRVKIRAGEEGQGGHQNAGDLGRYCRTFFHPVERRGDYTLLEAELFTGRTHQIRAHLAEAGHPVIGDVKYGDQESNEFLRRKFGLKHQLLHACRVAFAGDWASLFGTEQVEAPCPKLFGRIWSSL